MQSGAWPFSDVQDVKTRVLVNGVERPHSSWSIDRSITGDLPEQVASASGLRQATGSIDWTFNRDVVSDPVSPWYSFGEWLPKRGDRVEVWAGNSDVSYLQFKGVIDKTTGSVGEGFQSTIIDDYDKGSAKLRCEALLAVMPPFAPGGTFRGVGLTHTFYVDLAFRAMGFYATPPVSNAVVHVPCQGGMWPHIGTTTTARTNSGASYPTNTYSPWGFACGDFVQLLTPNNPGSMSNPVQLTMVVAPGHNDYAFVRAHYGGTYIVLNVSSSWMVEARIGGTVVASLALSGKGRAENVVVQLLVKGGVFTIKSSTGQTASGNGTWSGSTVMDVVRLEGGVNARVSGLQVTHPSAVGEFDALSFKPSAVINVSNTTMMGVQMAAPAINDQSANNLLDEISKATLSACWIDETGVMRWWPSIALLGRSASQVVTTLNDVLDMEWEDGLLQSAARVSIRYKSLALRISKFQNVRLRIGSGGTLESEESADEIIEPEADSAWYGVAETPTVLRTANWAEYNNKRGTYLGGFFSSNGQTTSETGLTYIGELLKMAHNKYIVKQRVGVLPADVVFNMSTSPTAAALWDTNRDKPLYEIGGHGVATWSDAVHAPTQAGGVGPELEHDGGIWIPNDMPQSYFNFIAGQTATPQPVISGLQVVFDPRRQLGDVIKISSEKYMRVSLTAVIVSMSNSAGSQGVEQTLSVRIISVERFGTTYRELNGQLPNNLTYAAFNALAPTPQRYSQFNNS